MSEAENIDRIVAALRKVPAKRLLLIDLANSIPIKFGDLDIEVLRDKQLEVNLAIAEVKAYGTHTIQAVAALTRLKAKMEE